jgi:hypothetical protein
MGFCYPLSIYRNLGAALTKYRHIANIPFCYKPAGIVLFHAFISLLKIRCCRNFF